VKGGEKRLHYAQTIKQYCLRAKENCTNQKHFGIIDNLPLPQPVPQDVATCGWCLPHSSSLRAVSEEKQREEKWKGKERKGKALHVPPFRLQFTLSSGLAVKLCGKLF